MKPSKMGIDYLLPIFTDAIGNDDVEHMRQTLFAPGNLAQPLSLDQHGRSQAHPVSGNGGRMNSPANLIPYINVKLALIGSPPVATAGDAEFTEIVSAMVGQ